MPSVDLDAIDTNDFCCRCDSVPIAHGTLTALIAELRAARAVVKVARGIDADPRSELSEALRAYDAGRKERNDAG